MRNLTKILIALVMLAVSSYSYSFCDGPATLLMCDTDIDSDIDVHDISAIGLAKGTTSSGPGDVRDVDGDGMITVLDARQCVSRCTLPNCADPDEGSITTPDVVGLSQAAAQSDIEGAGLVVGSVTTASSDTVPAGNVISQDPSGGVAVAEGTAVDIVVSSGTPTIPVPDVVNLSQAAAEDDILGAGLVVGSIVTQSSAEVPEGQVISQTPAAGLVVALNTPVDLVVSTGAVAEPGLIGGPAGGIAVEYIELVRPTASPAEALGEKFIFDRLLVSIEPDATVAEVNDALRRHDARISTSRPNTLRVTVRIDQEPTVTALNSKAAAMRAEAAFYDVELAKLVGLSELPIFADKSDISTFDLELLPYFAIKMPAVWNLRDRMLRYPDTTDMSIAVSDWFPKFDHPELPDLIGSEEARAKISHGLGVTSVIVAGYDGTGLTGVTPVEPANPIYAIDISAFSVADGLLETFLNLPTTGNLVVNSSWGYDVEGPFVQSELLGIALDALDVKILYADSTDRILHTVAAGNDGLPLADTLSPYAIASRFDNPCEIRTDPPESLPLTPADRAYCEDQRALQAAAMGSFVDVALPNILIVGSAVDNEFIPGFTNQNYDIATYGQDIITACTAIFSDPSPCMPGRTGSTDITGPVQGTSFSAPQIAGLAFVMKRLRPDAPLNIIGRLITNSGDRSNTLLSNAYSAVLELDRVPPGGGGALSGLTHLTVANSVRGGLLDVRDHSADPDTPLLDDAFTEVDLEAFIDAFIGDPLEELDAEPGERNFSRFDLNGDEKTGGADGTEFDLNNDGDFTTASVVIGGESFTYDETNVTDGNILCYMTFASDFYEGSPEYRDIIFALFGADLCVPLDYALDLETSLEITELSLPDFWVISPGDPVVLNDIIPNRDPITSYRGNYRAPAGSNCFFGERGSPRHSLASTLAGGNFYIPDITNAPYANNFGPVKDGCSNFIAFENGAAWINVTRRLDRRSGSFIFENESQMRISVPKSTGLGERTGFIEFYFLGTQTDTGSPVGDFDLDFQLELKFTSS